MLHYQTHNVTNIKRTVTVYLKLIHISLDKQLHYCTSSLIIVLDRETKAGGIKAVMFFLSSINMYQVWEHRGKMCVYRECYSLFYCSSKAIMIKSGIMLWLIKAIKNLMLD